MLLLGFGLVLDVGMKGTKRSTAVWLLPMRQDNT